MESNYREVFPLKKMAAPLRIELRFSALETDVLTAEL